MRCFDFKKGSIYSKKGAQATSLVILGLVILGIVLLLGYMRTQFLFGPVTIDKLEQRGMAPIREHIGECIEEVAPDYFSRIARQGGYLSTPEDTFRKFDGDPVSYLCYNVENSPACYNRYLTVGDMESQLETAIRQGLSTCIDLGGFARGAQLTVGDISVDVDIGDYESVVELDFPVRIQRREMFVEENEFIQTLDVPLGALYGVTRDIIDLESTVGEFEQLSYMLAHKGQFFIEKKKPYPDKLYIIWSKDDEDFLFQFFVQGEPS
jgi:hypothetical protein